MISRRQLIRGSLSSYADERYPPWAIPAAQFVQRCSRCDACLTSCPEQIIKHNTQGFPVVDFSAAGCTFCATCVDSCENGSLSRMAFIGAEPWPLKAVINRFCVNHDGGVCRVCADACEYSAISFHVRNSATAFPQIDLDRCTGCGQCYRSCPKRAIRVKPV